MVGGGPRRRFSMRTNTPLDIPCHINHNHLVI